MEKQIDIEKKDITILYLDDEEYNLKSFHASFRRDFNIITTNNVNDAKSILKKQHIDIVFSDQRMFDISGVDFLEYVSNKYPKIIRILITAYVDYQCAVDGINRANIYKLINKPYDYNELLSIINNVSIKILESRNNILIDEIKNKNLELQRTEELYRTLVNNIPGLCVIIFDRDYNYLLADGEALDTYEYSNLDIEGKNIRDVLEPSVAESIIKSYDISFEKNIPISMDFEKNSKNYHTSFIPIISEEGHTNDRGLVVVFETTEIKKIEKELEDKVNELKRANDYLDNFVYAIAHDLKSPVTNIKSLMGLIGLGVDKDVIIHKMKSGISRLDKTLDSLVEIIDVQKNIYRIPEVVDLQEIAKLVESNIEHHIQNIKPIITYNFKIKKMLFVEGYLISIFQNLLSNSLKYASNDRDCIIDVKAELDEDTETIIITFKDNGIGIEKKNYSSIFKPFNRLTTQSNGKGIGLHIVKSIVEQSGGRIIVSSEIGKGSEFRVYLKEF